eukprot:scaffold57532_cov63-Phaeocystis_antarctica.AAC.3
MRVQCGRVDRKRHAPRCNRQTRGRARKPRRRPSTPVEAVCLRSGDGVAECSEVYTAALVRGVRAPQSLAFCSSGCSLDSFAARSSAAEVRTTLRAEGRMAGPPRRLAAAAAGGAPAG